MEAIEKVMTQKDFDDLVEKATAVTNSIKDYREIAAGENYIHLAMSALEKAALDSGLEIMAHYEKLSDLLDYLLQAEKLFERKVMDILDQIKHLIDQNEGKKLKIKLSPSCELTLLQLQDKEEIIKEMVNTDKIFGVEYVVEENLSDDYIVEVN